MITIDKVRNRMKAQRVFPLCLCVLAGVSLVALMPVTTYAQSDVQSRLKRLENDVDTLNRAVYKGETPPPVSQGARDATANNEVRLGQLESEIRTLTGKVEEQTYQNQQLQQRLDALEQEARMRIEALEKGSATSGAAPATTGEIAPNASSTRTADGVPKALLPDESVASDTTQKTLDAASLYEQGFTEIKAGNYDAAEKTFTAFKKQYPDHALMPNAMYWLGETYYARKNYDKASRTFAESYQKYPKGPKGADNLLKLGLSLAAKGEKPNACIALGQLQKEYPDGPAPVLKRGNDERATLGCQ